MKALITGADGQLGQALQRTAPEGAEVVATTSSVLDIGDAKAVRSFVSATGPQILINAAAYTAVDQAETDSELAFRINGDAVGFLARAGEAVGARFVHVSTDFVFDGEAGRPYAPDAPTAPIGVYGCSKLRGEHEAGEGALIVRTAWVYGSQGNNFVRTILRLIADRDELRVVADQIGTPTWASSLADGIWKLAAAGANGVYHYTDSGAASWYDLAVAVQEEALELGLVDRTAKILPIPSSAYPTPARRPHYSVLDKEATTAMLGLPAPHWRANLRLMLREVRDQS
ncbi:dTDP-4-dehydrorhamnose reductase [Sphingopyxis sp.]|uniref:dTDP-4-dehydrorhamnose reductase n=1 Tax=Sphingopyxis sp. TaxID=1908224 RepID=UPI001DBBF8AA|nr:dTDP-4-dehydrorhamnose reductase [Sphingopyxis sp.]MBW8295550.1 dTDP-4-dehydrorhamnose reductase [Sphingopyxis sp.]